MVTTSGRRTGSEGMPSARLVPELYCSDFERSLQFYTTVLGFSLSYTRVDERFAYLDRDGAQIMIEQSTERAFVAGELSYPYGRGINFQIQVSDVHALYAQVLAEGSHVYHHLEDQWYRCDHLLLVIRHFVVQDPDGYLR